MSLGRDFATLTALAIDNREAIEMLVGQLARALARGDEVTLSVRARYLDDSLESPPITERGPR